MQEASNGRRQQIVDLKEELGVKDEKICDLQDKLANKEAIEDLNLTKKTLFEELAKAESEEIIKELKDKVSCFEKDQMASKIKAQNRIEMLQKLEALNNSNKNDLEKLKEKIKSLANLKKFPRCSFGKYCLRRFCKFDHSHVFSKVNKSGNNFSCKKM